ncbi:MAG: 6,7-dimethyl-8-ribityllumazine synthase [Chitinophagales bacterium]|jgi:6,7-dimethyl-8-ribityllumazine synthase|nr:6,7-dimethyl-8-ribityllumazine synthase [Chitinophagales bacterium]
MSHFIQTLQTPYDYSQFDIGIVFTTYHKPIVDKLLHAAIETLKAHKVQSIQSMNVSGSYELVHACNFWFKENPKLMGIITLGCVIKGETRHDDYINQAIANGLLNISSLYQKPISFGVLTTLNEAQAWDRAGGSKGNKGQEAAIALLDSLTLSQKIKAL